MSDFEFEREDILPYQETGFDGKVREVVNRMFREPTSLPEEFRGWLPFFIEQSNVQVPKSQVIGFASAEVPVGAITMYPVLTAPTGWILCDGTAVSRTDHSLLFGVIGTTYGSGDGSSTFNVPNYKGRVPVGRDQSINAFDTLAETGGASEHTLTESEMPSHVHGPAGDGISFWMFKGANGTGQVASGPIDVVQGTTGSAGSDDPHNNLQPYLVVNFIIKAV